MSDLTGPLDAHALAEGLRILKLLPSGIKIDHVPLHWSVEGWTACDGAYNIVIRLADGKWTATVATDPTLNASDPPANGYAAHTWQRNSFGLGIGVNGMVGAGVGPANFGSQPVQFHELEVMCAVAAAAGVKYNIDTHAQVDGAPAFGTHAEFSIVDAYFPGDGDPEPRWDLARLSPSKAPLTKDEAKATGLVIRSRIADYKRAMMAPAR